MEEKIKNLTFGMSFIVSLILLTIYYFSLYDNGSVLEGQIQNAQKELASNNNEIEKLKKAIEDAERFKLTMAALGSEMERILLAIPAKLTSLELMKIISNEAKEVGVEIKSLTNLETAKTSSSDKSKKEFYEPVEVGVAISGSYNQIMMLLSKFTRLDKILIVKNLTLNIEKKGKVGSESPVMGLKGVIEAYRYVSETSETKGANAK